MANLNLLVEGDVKDWIDSRVRKGEFASAADYLSELVRHDRESRSDEERIEELRRMVKESLESGISMRTTREIFAEAVETARQRGTLRD